MIKRQEASSEVEWLEEFAGTALDQLTDEDAREASEVLQGIDATRDSRTYNAVSNAERWVEGYRRHRDVAAARERQERSERHRDYMQALRTMAECAELIQRADPPLGAPFQLPAVTPETLREMDGRRLDFLKGQLGAKAGQIAALTAELESLRATLDKAISSAVRKRATDALDAEIAARRADAERIGALSAMIEADVARRREERDEMESVRDTDAALADLMRRVAALEGAS